MRVIDIINHVCEVVGAGERDNIGTKTKNMVLDILNIEYEKVYNLYPWDDTKVLNVSATTTDGVLIFPSYVDAITAVRRTTSPLLPIGHIFVNNYSPGDFTQAGTPVGYIPLAPSPVLTQPSAATTVSILSNSTSDNSGVVRVEGLSGGVTAFEELSLDGTTEVNGTTSFTEINQVTKPRTTGNVTVQDSADASLALLLWHETRGSYKRIQTVPIVDSSTTVTVQCTRKFERLISDNDSVLLQDAEAAIIKLTIAHAFSALKRNTEMFSVYSAEGSEELRVAFNKHDRVNVKDNRFLPYDGMFGDMGDGSYPQDISVTGIGVQYAHY